MEGVVNFRSSRDNKSVEFTDWSSNTINPDENIIYDNKRLFITSSRVFSRKVKAKEVFFFLKGSK